MLALAFKRRKIPICTVTHRADPAQLHHAGQRRDLAGALFIVSIVVPTAPLTRASPRGTSCSRVSEIVGRTEAARGYIAITGTGPGSKLRPIAPDNASGITNGMATARSTSASKGTSRTTSIPPGMSPRTPDARR